MGKQIFKRLMVVGIMIGALFMIGNNVFADHSFNSGPSYYSDYENRSTACSVGGCGASSCAIGAQGSFWNIGMKIQVSITCQDGYHACCNVGGASCVSSSNCPDLEDGE